MALINPNSKKFKKLMARLYGIGAAIVILGALFKLMDWPGLNRKLGNQKGQVFINDTACRIIGDISMDSFVADISEVYAQEGQEVTIFSPKYSVSKLANDLDTIPYEIMATLNRRIKRVYSNE